MREKGSNFFEEHIEKIVLAGIGLVCIGLLITRVLIGPNYVSYDDKKFGPGDIDNYIRRQAELLEDELNRSPEPKPPYIPRFNGPISSNDPVRAGIGGDLRHGFVGLVDSAIGDIDVSLSPPVPPRILRDIRESSRAYRIPPIGEVKEVLVEHIRAVAYVPTERIDEENVYDQDNSEPNDIDFVTVEAKFDVASLVENFYESFAGEDVQEEWRDPCLAKPVFAAVQLQRQELLADGSWSDWQNVPRTKVDHRRRKFEIIEEIKELPLGGVRRRVLEFDNAEVRVDLLQPVAYNIASAKEEWFPPSLHKRFVKVQGDIAAKEKREAREAEREEREQEREKARGEREREESRAERSSRSTEPRVRSGGDMEEMLKRMMEPSGGVSTRRTPTRRSRSSDRRSDRERYTRVRERGERGERESEKERLTRRDAVSPRLARSREVSKPTSISDIYDEFNEILITEKMDFAKMREPLMFWAYDDIVEPKKSYRYRIRLGVFNPIAGTNQFSKQYELQKNKVVLWGKFSDVTETVEIPGMLYFFPREVQEAARTVTVTVCRYVLDYWYSKDFMVRQGEVIGKIIESETVEEEEEVTKPETIDYATGAVLVDVTPVNDWFGGKNLRARYYFDMLYSFDGANIERMSVRPRYWPEELQLKFNEIKKSEKELKEPLRDWGSRPGQRRRRAPRRPGEEVDMGEEFKKMLEEMNR